MIRFFNIFFTIFFLPAILILSIFNKKIRAGWMEKLGCYDFDLSDENDILWIHAISVGEVQLVLNIIDKLKDYKIVLTTSTPQGQEFAKEKLSNICRKITYFPYDFCWSVRNAFKAINPCAVLIAETEIWPEFSAVAKFKNIPLVIFNGRISDKTFKSYKRLGFFFNKVLKNYFAILTQSEDDKERFVKIGAKPETTLVMGNIKFDIKKPEHKDSILNLNGSPLIVAGSTHNGEDEIIIKTFKNLKKKYSNLKLLIAPRHLERISQIKNLTNSALKSTSTFEDNDILILDTTGELKYIYSLANAVFMGGSFNDTGGHNPLEATIFSVPVISGENVKNFRLIYKILCEANCAKIVKTQHELEKEFDKLLGDKKYYDDMKKNCSEIFEKNKGASDKLIDFIKKELDNGK